MNSHWLAALALFLAVAGFHSVSSAGSKRVVCYFGSWAVYRPGNGKFEVEYIDPTLCTHLIYTFVGISVDGNVKILDAWNDLPDGYGKDAFARFNKLRAKSPNTKTLIAIGGWNEGSSGFSSVINNPATRSTLVKNVVAFVKKYGFDGFDLDWEYPNQRGGIASDKAAFGQFLAELRVAFDANGLILSAAIGVGVAVVDGSYDFPSLSKNLDFINVMTYDLHGPWDGVTGQNAPLYASSADKTAGALALNVNAAIHNLLNHGVPAEKMNLGMATYGHCFAVNNADHVGVGVAMSGAGQAGPYTRQDGMLGYNEICENQKNGGWNIRWDDEQKVPITTKGNQWCGYDNVQSIKLKTQYAKDLGLGGAMIWSIETDDFLGTCGNKYPLLHAINQVFNGGSSGGGDEGSTTTGTSVTTGSTTTEPSTTTSSGGGGTPSKYCKAEGFVRDPTNCQIFYRCVLVDGTYQSYPFACQGDLVFDTTLDICNFRTAVQC